MPTVLGAISIGLCLGLPSMLAGWSAIRSGAWRYVVTVLLALLNGIILTCMISREIDLLLVLLPLASAVPTIVTLWLIKRFYGRFAPLESETEHFPEGLRFNLSHLFIVTTLLAVLLAIGKALEFDIFDFVPHPDEFVVLSCLVVLFSFNTLLHVWALMGHSAVLRVFAVVPIALVSLMTCTWFCIPDQYPSPVSWYLIIGLPLVLSFLLMTATAGGGF